MEIFYRWNDFDETNAVDIVEHIDEAIVMFDKNGTIVEMNSICDDILPFKRSNVIGKTIDEIVKMGLVSDPIINMLLDKRKKVYKNIVYPSGKVVAFTAIPMWTNENVFKGGILVGRNISIFKAIGSKNESGSDEAIEDEDEYTSISSEMNKLKSIVNRASMSDSSIFVTGETGVGKEVLARYVHRNSARQDKCFIAVNCGAIPSELIESEFFGYEEGSFTGAKKTGKVGIIERANGGTLFLDEIGELGYEMQKKLLRVIQENEFTKVGSNTPKKVDIRYICATNKTVDEVKNPEKFRQDLYYRLNVIPIRIPALRERRDDIVPMARYFLGLFNKKYYRNIKLSSEVETLIENNEWRGNVRELKNIMERVVVLSVKDNVSLDQFKMIMNLDSLELLDEKDNGNNAVKIFEGNENTSSSYSIDIDKNITLNEAVRILEQRMIEEAIKKHGSIHRAAASIGIDPCTIYRKVKRGDIKLNKD
ncbi:MAG: sigma-54 interaction domain-containing protein [Filifactoraceae bacterium]